MTPRLVFCSLVTQESNRKINLRLINKRLILKNTGVCKKKKKKKKKKC